MTHILLVEDDEMIGTGLKQILDIHHYQVDLVQNCTNALKAFHSEQYELCILDIRLPDGNGIELCRKLRRYTDIPILFLSVYEDESCIVEALRNGGDDYLIKPFRSMELMARIEALLRRKMAPRKLIGYVSGGAHFLFGKTCGEKDGKHVEFTALEWSVLHTLLCARGTIVTPEMLISQVSDAAYISADTQEVRVWISRLRRKLMQLLEEDCIRTCRNIGYRWELKVEDLYE